MEQAHTRLAGVQRIVLPLEGSPLESVNVYVLDGAAGLVLVDTGWRRPDVRAALDQALAALGYRAEDLALIVLTHAHPDHCGGAAELRKRSGAPVLLHHADWPLTDPARRHGDAFMRASAAWFLRHGLPASAPEATGAARGELVERNQPFTPDWAIHDGDTLALGRFTMRVLWCPGHSPGQVCLYDEQAGVLLAGDHVLPAISPNIGCYTAEDGNPLGDYLASLRRVRDLPVDVVFPGHGEPFHELAARVDTLAAHHEARLDELLALLAPAPQTGFDLCVRLPWSGGRRRWADLAPFHHRLALAETIAHLELLRSRSLVSREEREGIIRYQATLTPYPL